MGGQFDWNAMVSSIPTTSTAAWVKGVLRLFASQGVDTSRLLTAAGIDAGWLERHQGRLDLQQMNRLWQLAVEASGQETLGLDRTLAARFVDLELASVWVGAETNLGSLLERHAHYSALTHDAAAFTLEREYPDTWLTLLHGNDPTLPRQRYEYGLLAILLVAQRATRRPLRPLAVDLVFPEPADAHRHRMAFQCPLRFDRPANRILLAGDDLLLPVVASNPSLQALEERVLEALLAASGSSRTSFRVSQAMVRRLLNSEPQVASIAEEIGLSEAVLVRQLRGEKTTLPALQDQVRRQLAHAYLAGSDCPLSQVPQRVGLPDEAQFEAACKRWFGATAAVYRLHHGLDLLPQQTASRRVDQPAGR